MKITLTYSTFEKKVAGFVNRNFPKSCVSMSDFEYHSKSKSVFDAYINIGNLILLKEITGQQDGLLHEQMINSLMVEANTAFNASTDCSEISRLHQELRTIARNAITT